MFVTGLRPRQNVRRGSPTPTTCSARVSDPDETADRKVSLAIRPSPRSPLPPALAGKRLAQAACRARQACGERGRVIASSRNADIGGCLCERTSTRGHPVGCVPLARRPVTALQRPARSRIEPQPSDNMGERAERTMTRSDHDKTFGTGLRPRQNVRHGSPTPTKCSARVSDPDNMFGAGLRPRRNG